MGILDAISLAVRVGCDGRSLVLNARCRGRMLVERNGMGAKKDQCEQAYCRCCEGPSRLATKMPKL